VNPAWFAGALIAFAALMARLIVLHGAMAFCAYLWACARRWFD